MIPRRLKLTAFGPYKHHLDLNFDELGEHRLFLITGPTGAGKSTIFEALYFALYGQVSEEGRVSRSVRSDFTEDVGLETEVDFTFDVGQKTYRILRKPAQSVPYKRQDGFREQSAQVELYLNPARPPITNLREAQECIEEIIGLDADQFKKIVMLPQGAFQDFLLAQSDEKRNILRHIFNTELYASLQREAKEHSLRIDRAFVKTKEKFQLLWSQLPEKGEDASVGLQERLENLFASIESAGQSIRQQKEQYQLVLASEEKARINLQKARLHQERLEKIEADRAQWTKLELEKERVEALEEKISSAQKAKELAPLEKAHQESLRAYRIAYDALDESQLAYRVQKRDKVLAVRSLREKEGCLSQAQMDAECLETLKEESRILTQITEKETQLFQIREAYRLEEEALKKDRQALKLSEEQLQDLLKNMSNYKEMSLGQSLLHTEAADLRIRIDRLEEKKKHAKAYEESFRSEYDLEKFHQEALASEEGASQALQKGKEAWSKKQAAHLAEDLQEGEPCPVCGATHHPSVQKISDGKLPDIEALEAALLKAREKLHRSSFELQSLKQKRESLEGLLQTGEGALESLEQASEEIGGLLDQAYAKQLDLHIHITKKAKAKRVQKALEKAEELLLKRQHRLQAGLRPREEAQKEKSYRQNSIEQEIKRELARFSGERPKVEELLKRIEGIERNLEESLRAREEAKDLSNQEELALTLKRADLSYAGRAFQRAKEDNQRLEKDFNEAILKGFENLELYEEARENINQLETWQQIIEDYRQEKALLALRIKEGEKELSHEEKLDIQAFDAAFHARQEESRLAQRVLISEQNAQSQRTRLYRQLKEAYEESRELEAAYQTSRQLADLLNGQNPLRMDFETYVLAAYFEAVLTQANVRLIQMSNGRYYFVRKEEVVDKRRNQGLDLAMMDLYTGKDREVATLSGGERFKAALSLALGLADVVGEASGGIELSTIFIDEGFGTLDEASLDQTLDSLFALQEHGRLVGIISHVPELKERIEAQIQVTSGPEGSNAAFVISS